MPPTPESIITSPLVQMSSLCPQLLSLLLGAARLELLSARLANLVRADPLAFNGPSTETSMIEVVAGKVAVLDEAASSMPTMEVDDFVLRDISVTRHTPDHGVTYLAHREFLCVCKSRMSRRVRGGDREFRWFTEEAASSISASSLYSIFCDSPVVLGIVDNADTSNSNNADTSNSRQLAQQM